MIQDGHHMAVGRSFQRANVHPVRTFKQQSRWDDPIGGTGCVLGAFVPFVLAC